jgi:hypothetical protein
MKKVKYWDVNYRIEYPSGKVWKERRIVSGENEQEAIENVKWLKSLCEGRLFIVSILYVGHDAKSGIL